MALKKLAKKLAGKAVKKAAPAKPAKKAAPAKPAKKAAPVKPVKKAAPAKKAAPVKKAPAKKAAPVKKAAPAKPVKKAAAPVKKAAAKKPDDSIKTSAIAGSKATLKVDTKNNTVQVAMASTAIAELVVEEKRLMMPPPPPPKKSGKQTHLKPIKAAPAALVVSDAETWSATELKAMRSNLSKELDRLRVDLAKVESEMDSLIKDGGEGAGDDQADAGNKTFEREHEMSLLINARDMVIQTERAIERIDNKSYGVCEVCGNAIGKARLEVFPRATLCMSCKQKEERR
jgi:RNA polymerase-binding transcription factor DksA